MDVPGDKLPSQAGGALAAHLRAHVAPQASPNSTALVTFMGFRGRGFMGQGHMEWGLLGVYLLCCSRRSGLHSRLRRGHISTLRVQ